MSRIHVLLISTTVDLPFEEKQTHSLSYFPHVSVCCGINNKRTVSYMSRIWGTNIFFSLTVTENQVVGSITDTSQVSRDSVTDQGTVRPDATQYGSVSHWCRRSHSLQWTPVSQAVVCQGYRVRQWGLCRKGIWLGFLLLLFNHTGHIFFISVRHMITRKTWQRMIPSQIK